METLACDGRWGIELATRLLDDHAEFAPKLIGIEERIANLIGLQRHGIDRVARRNCGVIHRAIIRGVGVERATECLGSPGEFAGAEGWRSLEEHMLEDVRNPGDRIGLVEKPGPDVRHQCGCGRRPATLDQQRDAVGKSFAPEPRGRVRAHARPPLPSGRSCTMASAAISIATP